MNKVNEMSILTRIQKGSSIYAVYDLMVPMSALDRLSMMMINHNQNGEIGLAPITLEESSGCCTRMLFDVTGKVTLREYISKNITQQNFRSMLMALIHTLEEFDEYMIDAQQVLMDLDSVFINELDHSIAFLCIAVKDQKIDGNLHEFFKLVVENSRVSTENQEISYFNRVWNVLHNANGFSLQNMKTSMSQVEQQEAAPSAAAVPIVPPEPKKVEEPPTITVTPQPAAVSETLGYVPPIKQDEKKKGLFGLFSSSKKRKTETPQQTGFQAGLAGYKNGGKAEHPAFSPMQTPVAAPPMPAAAPSMPAAMPAMAAAPVSASPMDFGGTTVLGARKKEPLDAAVIRNRVPVGQPVEMPQISPSMGTTVLRQPTDAPAFGSADTTVLNPAGREPYSPGTTVLAAPVKKTACLIRLKNHERVFVNKPTIMIGRDMPGLDCDVHDNTAVGHKHASIVQRQDSYFIVDFHSANRTYVNGMPIAPGVETQIKDGDQIRLANEDFEFKII